MLRRNIPELTALRFFAALAVVLSHLHGLGFINIGGIHDFLDGGRTAVAFFFILSGFVLAIRYAPGKTMDGYMVARFARVYPIHALTLLMSVVPVLLIVRKYPDMAADLFFLKEHPAATLSLSFIAQIFLLTAWLPFAAMNQPWNGPAWSLSCEIFFYACFPWLRSKINRLSVIAILLVLVAGWVAQGCWLAGIEKLLPASRGNHIIYQLPLSHLFEFVAGVCFGILCERGDLKVLGENRVFVVAITLACIAALSYVAPINPAYYLLSPLFLILIGSVAAAQRPVAFLTNRTLVLLGGASYSLYLAHVPILLMLKAIDLPVHPMLVLGGLVLTSVVLFRFVEEPCRRQIVARMQIKRESVSQQTA